MKTLKIYVKYFGSTASFLSYNGSDKSWNKIELNLLQTFYNYQNTAVENLSHWVKDQLKPLANTCKYKIRMTSFFG